MRILFATDGSPAAESTLERLQEVLGLEDMVGLSIVIVAVSSSQGSRAEPGLDAASAVAGLERAKEILARQGLPAKSIWRVGQDAAAMIFELAARERADVVVIGNRAWAVSIRQQAG